MDPEVMSKKVDNIFDIFNEIMNSPGNEDKKLDISKTFLSKFSDFYRDSDEYNNYWDFIHILIYHYFKSGQEDICRFIISNSKTIIKDLKNNEEINSLMYSLLSDCYNYIEDPEEYSSCVNLIKLVLNEGVKAGLNAGYKISSYNFNEQSDFLKMKEMKDITDFITLLGIKTDF